MSLFIAILYYGFISYDFYSYDLCIYFRILDLFYLYISDLLYFLSLLIFGDISFASGSKFELSDINIFSSYGDLSRIFYFN